MAWACYDGSCAGGVPATECALGQVRLTCGTSGATWSVPVVDEVLDPPSSLLAFVPALPPGITSGGFTIRPALQHADGSSEVLCSVAVAFTDSDSAREVLDAAYPFGERRC